MSADPDSPTFSQSHREPGGKSDSSAPAVCNLTLPRHIPMKCFHMVSRILQPQRQLFRHHHTAMLAAGAAKGHRQVALPFLNIVRQQVEHQVRHPFKKLHRLRKAAHILSHLGILARLVAKLRHKVRIGQKANIEDHVRVQRHAVLEAETQARNKEVLGLIVVTEARQNIGAQLVHVEIRSVNQGIGNVADGIEKLPLFHDRT